MAALLVLGVTAMPETTSSLARFDRDPEALEWARTKIQAAIARYEANAERATAEGRDKQAATWQATVDALQRDLIGGQGEYAEFDERLPRLLARSTREARDGR